VCEIADHYAIAFGTRFAEARRTDHRHDIPRIDMHYFRAPLAWRNFLEGGSVVFYRTADAAPGRAGAAKRLMA
jgi:hypothetical protein